ncbi:DUF418 domain-containing protein [Ureibacillus thermophilus]|uniref:DUF418 domain-containing protein n=1 Tax=Ureibacillus thermophilus TaxID=367743 RepID=UPI00361C62DA
MFQPTTLNERIQTLDIIRGVSLLGILLVNIFAFSLPLPHVQDLNSWFTDIHDQLNYQKLDIYVQGSFYPLFSMLFGYGLAMQYMKAQQRTGAKFYSFAAKRLLILMMIGLMHAFLLWWGDIITLYAVFGLFVILLLRFSSGLLLSVALILNGFFHVLIILLYAMSGIATSEYETFVDISAIENAIAAYGVGTWTDAFLQRLQDLSVQMSPAMWVSAVFTIFPYMLVGAAAAKWRLVERAKELKGLWIFLAVFCIAVGLFLKSFPFHATRTYLWEYIRVYVGGPMLAVGYASLIAVLCLIPFVPKLLSPIAKAGRMSLTLYIMQSIICTLLFYHYGFGLYGKVDVVMGIVIAISIYIVQAAFAEIWFIKFRQGPLEYIVKRLAYGKTLKKVEP